MTTMSTTVQVCGFILPTPRLNIPTLFINYYLQADMQMSDSGSDADMEVDGINLKLENDDNEGEEKLEVEDEEDEEPEQEQEQDVRPSRRLPPISTLTVCVQDAPESEEASPPPSPPKQPRLKIKLKLPSLPSTEDTGSRDRSGGASRLLHTCD